MRSFTAFRWPAAIAVEGSVGADKVICATFRWPAAIAAEGTVGADKGNLPYLCGLQ